MSGLDRLAARAGRWQGSSRLHDPHTGKPDDSASTAVVTTLLGGRFIRLDYDWSYQGVAQEGSLLIGFQSVLGKATVHWIDSWHMSDGVMACEGAAEPDGTIDVRGSYAAPPGPDWGWRIELRSGDGSSFRVVMHNVTPDGQEALAVEAAYERITDGPAAAVTGLRGLRKEIAAWQERESKLTDAEVKSMIEAGRR